MNNINEIAFYVLQNEYLKRIGCDKLSVDDIIDQEREIFPDQWPSLDIDNKLKIVSYSLSHNCNLFESCEHFEKTHEPHKKN